MRIGLLYSGNELDSIWGAVVTTFYLSSEFKKMCYDVWRESINSINDYNKILSRPTDMLISEGVPEWMIPQDIFNNSNIKIFWWLSKLFYNEINITKTNFNGIATNSESCYNFLRKNKIKTKKIDLCVSSDIINAKINKQIFNNYCVYLGKYPHKSSEQMALIFQEAAKYNLGLWGHGWENSIYKKYYKGILEVNEIGSLYKSTEVSFLLTEQKQKESGMINNRVYEVIGSGSIPISEPYKYLENSELGEFINFVNSKEEVQEILIKAKKDNAMKEKSYRGQKFVLSKHNYKIRAKEFIQFYYSLL